MFQPLCLMQHIPKDIEIYKPNTINVDILSIKLFNEFNHDIIVYNKKNLTLRIYTQFHECNFFNIKKFLIDNLPSVKRVIPDRSEKIKFIDIIFDESMKNFL